MKHRLPRENPENRKKEILQSAISYALDVGYDKITRDGVAIRMGCSYSLVSYYFENINVLKKEVLKEAIKQEILSLIAEGMIMKDPQVSKICSKLKKRVLAHLYNI